MTRVTARVVPPQVGTSADLIPVPPTPTSIISSGCFATRMSASGSAPSASRSLQMRSMVSGGRCARDGHPGVHWLMTGIAEAIMS
jgi:hypothetical protein